MIPAPSEREDTGTIALVTILIATTLLFVLTTVSETLIILNAFLSFISLLIFSVTRAIYHLYARMHSNGELFKERKNEQRA